MRKKHRSTSAASPRLQSLVAYLEELYRETCQPWPPPCGPAALPSSTKPAHFAESLAEYLVWRSTRHTMCDAPFFSTPLPEGEVCVSDYGNHAVRILADDDATSLHSLAKGGAGPGELTHPLGLALGSSGKLYVADGAGRVQLFDEYGQCERVYSLQTRAEAATAPGPNEAWLPDGGAKRIGREPSPPLRAGELSERNPALEPPIVEHGGAVPSEPCGVALGPGGRLYVSERGHDRIVCFASGGEIAFAFGARGSGLGELHDPRGLAVHAGQVWIADMCNHRIAIFSLRGTPLRTIGRFGEGPAEFRHPVGVALSAELLLVSEYSGGRLQVLTPAGECLQVVRHPSFGGACLCALGADARHLTVTDTASRLHRFDFVRRGTRPAAEPAPLDAEAEGDLLVLSAARDAGAEARARAVTLRGTRGGRVRLAVEASDYAGVLASLTRDDLAALVPEALAHAAAHPARYQFPPERSADALVAEFDQHLAGRAPPLGPPHW